MGNLVYYLIHNKIKDENWALFRLVAWYCQARRINLPKGRCHFGEIVGLYVPIFVTLGLTYKLITEFLWPIIRFMTQPLWRPVLWFSRKLVKGELTQEKGIRAGLISLGWAVFMLLLFIVGWVYDELHGGQKDNDVLFLIPAILLIPITFWVLTFLSIWTYERYKAQIDPVLDLSREAAGALRRPTFKKAGSAAVFPLKIVPALALLAAVSVRWGWRRAVCPRLEYEFDTSKYQTVLPTETN